MEELDLQEVKKAVSGDRQAFDRVITAYSGKFDKEVISEKDVKIFNNVIEPDKGERVTLIFNVYSGDNVKVKVYTRSGVLMATLFDGVITQVGTKELYWEGKNDSGNIINSGTYLITIETSHYKATEKVAVVR